MCHLTAGAIRSAPPSPTARKPITGCASQHVRTLSIIAIVTIDANAITPAWAGIT